MTENSDNRRHLRYRFPRRLRLSCTAQFREVYDSRVRVKVGPLMVHGRPNDLGHPRLGMAVPRHVGTAVTRNRIRRLLREAMRLMQHDLPGGYDLVIGVRRHDPLTLADYQRALAEAVRSLHKTWSKTPPT